ncbi:MAG: hypothetical protein AAFO29_19855 [Actinomycetota bacterium]
MTSDDHTDAYDPEIAERFALLERLTPPPAPVAQLGGVDPEAEVVPIDQAAAYPAELVEAGHPSNGPRSPVLLAVAAAAAVIAGVSVFALSGGGSGPELVEAGPAGAEGEELAVTTTRPADGSDADADTDAGESDDGAAGDAEPMTVEVPDETAAEVTPTTGTTLPPTSASTDTVPSSTEATDDDTTDDTVDAIPLDTTIPGRPTGSVVDPSKAGEMATLSGPVTEIFTDCQSWLVLNEDGEAEHRNDISCDGGSFITVQGQRIQTTSGFVPAELAFDKHPVGLQPGDAVVVTAIHGPYGGLTLDCDSCGISR